MTIYYSIMFFILGTIMGSFYNVVGYRVPKKESLLFPSSHCPNCNHKLGPLELIPIFSYIFLGGKCKECKKKISMFYPLFEFFSGLLFMLSYLVFGFSLDCLFAITFASLILIIIISDLIYMIIDDITLIVFAVLLLIEIYFINGFNGVGTALLNGLLSFGIMFLIKLLGDFIFKKESMGGGDIKLMFTFGIVLGYQMSIVSIFLASFIALPIAVYFSLKYKDKKYIEDDEIPEHSIPFGPFLAVAAIIILLTRIDISFLVNLFY